MLSSILPEGLDAGDIFLAAMLLFLAPVARNSSGAMHAGFDFEHVAQQMFLIILIVVGLSIFKKDKDN